MLLISMMEACEYGKGQRRLKEVRDALVVARRPMPVETGSGTRTQPSEPIPVQAESLQQISGSSKVHYLWTMEEHTLIINSLQTPPYNAVESWASDAMSPQSGDVNVCAHVAGLGSS